MNGFLPNIDQTRLIKGNPPFLPESVSVFADADSNKMMRLIRLLLALAGLIITFIDPAEPDRLVGITYITLILYVIFSGCLYFLSFRKVQPMYSIYWLDVLWFLLLISLSSGTNSIFFFFFFYAILAAAFQSGFKAGMQVTLICGLVFMVVSYATNSPGQEFELNRFLLRPICLLIIGYMISYLGGREINSKNRLALLNDINKISNPRFGVEQTLNSVMKKLLTFYQADACLFVTSNAAFTNCEIREINRENTNDLSESELNNSALSLLKLAGDYEIFYRRETKLKWQSPDCLIFDEDGNDCREKVNCAAIADLLETDSFISVSARRHNGLHSRLYLIAEKSVFEPSDLAFLKQAISNFLPVVENVQLLDRLASNAAEEQRLKISRDIHDSTIQPYIGLKLGLEALEMKYADDKPIGEDIDKLLEMANSTIGSLRNFVTTINSQTIKKEGDVLIRAIKQQAAKFEEFYGIQVDVQATDGFHINDRLAAEVFQIITEGLSNIRRHTESKSASVRIHSRDEKLFLELINDDRREIQTNGFFPKSIAGRAESLGGQINVECLNNHTKISIEIPL